MIFCLSLQEKKMRCTVEESISHLTAFQSFSYIKILSGGQHLANESSPGGGPLVFSGAH